MKPITTHPFTQDLLTSPSYFWNCRTKEQLEAWYSDEDRPNGLEALMSITQNNRKLFSLITTTIPTMHGWCPLDKACVLAGLVLAIKPISVTELGVWGGRSLLPMAFACQSLGTGIVTGIDPYSPQESAKGQFNPSDEKWWAEQPHADVKESFLKHIAIFGLSNHVRLIEKPADKVDTTGWKLQILHIDANHGESALHDAEKYGPLVQLGGVVICDDIGWAGGSVLRAIDELEGMGFVEVIRKDGWNIMQRVK